MVATASRGLKEEEDDMLEVSLCYITRYCCKERRGGVSNLRKLIPRRIDCEGKVISGKTLISGYPPNFHTVSVVIYLRFAGLFGIINQCIGIIALNDSASFTQCQNVCHTIIENKSASLISAERLARVSMCVFPLSNNEGNLT